MRIHRILAAPTVAATALLLQGCFGTDDNPVADSDLPQTEEQAIEYVALDEDAAYADPDVMWFDEDGDSEAALAPISTLHWRREVLSVDRSLDISIEKPSDGVWTADVVASADIDGLLHIWACADSAVAEVVKDFSDTAVRSLYFERVRDRETRHRGWTLMALSGVLIESPGTTRNIRGVTIEADGISETITGVTDLVRREDILALPAGAEITVTVATGDATDQVYLHMRHMRRRVQLGNNGDGTFTGTFVAGDRPGPRHIVVDVLSEGTLYDDAAAYDNLAWGIPYVIEGDMPGDGSDGGHGGGPGGGSGS